MSWNLRKRYLWNAAYFFMAFVTERPPIFLPCIHIFVWGECCSLKHGQKLENFVFSKQNRAIWWILSGANLIKVMKIKFQFYRLNRPNYAFYGWTSLEGRDDIRAIIHLVKRRRGYILQTRSINLHPWLSKRSTDDSPHLQTRPKYTNLKLFAHRKVASIQTCPKYKLAPLFVYGKYSSCMVRLSCILSSIECVPGSAGNGLGQQTAWSINVMCTQSCQ